MTGLVSQGSVAEKGFFCYFTCCVCGRMPERTKGADCKSAIRGFESHSGLCQHRLDVLTAIGFTDLKITAQDLCQNDWVIQLQIPALRFALMTSMNGVIFDQAWATQDQAALVDLPVCFICRILLLQNKIAAGSFLPTDLKPLPCNTGPTPAKRKCGPDAGLTQHFCDEAAANPHPHPPATPNPLAPAPD